MRIIPRIAWTISGPGGQRQSPRGGTLYVHWTVTSANGLTRWTKQAAHMRQLRQIHLNVGDADIAYSFICFPPEGNIERARIVRARGIGRVPASQLGDNAGNVSVSVVAKPGDHFDIDAVEVALKKLTRHLIREGVIAPGHVKGHRDQNSTSCPGDQLYRLVPKLRKVRA